jgi:DNA primase
MGDIVVDIKNRLDIVDVVAPYVELKKAGRNFKACCPFHSEKTPSFVVSPEKQIAYCFGCHKGGDMFKFIQEVEGVDFAECVSILADKAGLKADVKKFKSKGGKAGKSRKEELLEIHEEACKLFESKLLDKSEESKKVLAYLEKRNMTKEMIKEFRVGLATKDFDNLYKHLLKKGYKHDLLIKSGLFSLKDVAGKGIYDKFRLRLMFPIFDQMGRVIAFGGRALEKDQVPKYLNSPETAIYSKGKVLYGLSHAKQAIKEADKVVVVEGYFDVIALYQNDIKNIVASSGTALTPEQVKLISRFTKNIVSCFDTDSAGINATKRAYEVIQDAEMNMKTLKMTDEMKDPADFMVDRGKKGKDEFLGLVDGAENFLEFYMFILNKKFEVKTLEGRRKFLEEIVPLMKMMKSTVKMDHFVRILANYLDIKEKFLYDEIENFKVLRDQYSGRNEVKEVKSEKMSILALLISVLLEHPVHFSKVKEMLNEDDFEGELKNIYIEMGRKYNAGRTEKEGWGLDAEKMAIESGRTAFLSLYAEEKYGGFTAESVEFEVVKLIDKIVNGRRMHKRIELERALKDAEKEGDQVKKKKLLEEFQKLLTS